MTVESGTPEIELEITNGCGGEMEMFEWRLIHGW